MSDSALLAALSQHEVVRGLSPAHLAVLASGARPVHFAPGEYLGRESEPADVFYLIQSGQVTLGIPTPDRGVVVVQTVGPRQALGWSWLVPPHRWRFDCQAAEAVEALAFDARWLRQQCEQDNALGYHLLKQMLSVLANRLSGRRLQLLDLHR